MKGEMEVNETRPVLERRATYVPGPSCEQFIVPLLRDEIQAAIKTHLVGVTRPRVLDIGCGSQPFRQQIELTGARYFGCDVAQNSANSVDFEFPIDGALPDAILIAPTFDFILCTEVLEHVADWSAAFVNIKRLVSPGGIVVITCPQFYKLHEEPFDFWRPTQHALAYYARKEALTIVEVRPLGDSWDVLGTLLGSTWAESISKTYLARAKAKLFRICATLLYKSILNRRIRDAINLKGEFHLSTIAIFRNCSSPKTLG